MDEQRSEIQSIRRDIAGMRGALDALEARVDQLDKTRDTQPDKPIQLNPAETVTTPKPPIEKPAETVAPSPPPIPDAQPQSVKKATPPKFQEKPIRETALAKFVARIAEQVGPPKGLTLELLITTWLLPRLGMGILAVGVVFLATLAVQYFQNAWWMPYGRIAGGYALAGGLMVLSRYIRAGYQNLAPLLFSGGMALVYFVTFAMHFIPFSRIVDRPEPILLLLAIVVGAWAFYTVRMNSQRLGFITTFLGHGTVLLSTLYVDNPGILTMAGLLVLSSGSALLLARMRWYSVGAMGMVLSYLNYIMLLNQSTATPTVEGILVVLGMLALNHSIFALGELLAPAQLRHEQVKTRGRTFYVSTNTAGLLLVGAALLGGTATTAAHDYLFYFAVAAVLAAYSAAYWWRDAKDVLFNAYFIKASSVFTFGLALYFDATALVMALALECAFLLIGAQWMQRTVSRVMSHVLLLLTVVVGARTFMDLRLQGDFHDARNFLWMLLMTGSALLVAALVYAKSNWKPSTPKSLLSNKALEGLLWQLGLVQEAPQQGLKRILGGQGWPYAYAFAGTGLWTWGMHEGIGREAWLFMLLLALAVTLAGLAFRLRAFTGAAVVAGLTGAWVVVQHFQTLFNVHPVTVTAPNTMALIALGISMFALIEIARFTGQRWPQHWPQLHFKLGEREIHWNIAVLLYTLAGLAVTMAMVVFLISSVHYLAVTSIGVALLMTAYALLSGSYAIGAIALGLVGLGTLASFDTVNVEQKFYTVAMLLPIALCGEGRYLSRFKGLQFHQQWFVSLLLYLALTGMYVLFFADYSMGLPIPAGSLWLCAMALGLLTLWLHRQAMAGLSWAVLALYAFLMFVDIGFDGYESGGNGSALVGIALACVAIERYWAMMQLRKVLHWRNLMGPLLALVLVVNLVEYINSDWIWMACTVAGALLILYGSKAKLVAHLLMGAMMVIVTGASMMLFAYTEGLAFNPMLAGYATQLAVWVALERVYTARQDSRAGMLRLDAVTGIVAALLLLSLGYCLPGLEKFLTLNWGAGAILLFVLGGTTRQAWYRYAALTVLGLALLHVVAVDATRLEGIFRILAYIGLGIISIGVALGYTKFKDRV